MREPDAERIIEPVGLEKTSKIIMSNPWLFFISKPVLGKGTKCLPWACLNNNRTTNMPLPIPVEPTALLTSDISYDHPKRISNSCINPFLYTLLTKNYREYLRNRHRNFYRFTSSFRKRGSNLQCSWGRSMSSSNHYDYSSEALGMATLKDK
ncbi:hypothetical protein WISP_145602 [Willisornis vidua]|uniref:Uncharacterized protein n=1 Tax=Willisornis vidua TaxID=1566151 RepID=A0ABQ9CKV4_9PASS|nr:hypothetical protein WISP_145602 [Willisornis vidua]